MSKRYATEVLVLPTVAVRPLWEEVDIAARHLFGRMLAREGLPDHFPPWQWQFPGAKGAPELLAPEDKVNGILSLPHTQTKGTLELKTVGLHDKSEQTEKARYHRWMHRLDNARYRLPHLQAKVARMAAINTGWWLAVEGPSHQVFRLVMGAWAAALADHTAGLLHSEAGLWEYERFPATPREFERWFFRPEHCAYPDWAQRTRKHWQRIAECLMEDDHSL